MEAATPCCRRRALITSTVGILIASASPFTVIASPSSTSALVWNSRVTACRSAGGSGLSNPSVVSGASAGPCRLRAFDRFPGAGRRSFWATGGARRSGGGVARIRGGVARRTGRGTAGTILRSVAPGRKPVPVSGEAMLRVSSRRGGGFSPSAVGVPAGDGRGAAAVRSAAAEGPAGAAAAAPSGAGPAPAAPDSSMAAERIRTSASSARRAAAAAAARSSFLRSAAASAATRRSSSSASRTRRSASSFAFCSASSFAFRSASSFALLSASSRARASRTSRRRRCSAARRMFSSAWRRRSGRDARRFWSRSRLRTLRASLSWMDEDTVRTRSPKSDWRTARSSPGSIPTSLARSLTRLVAGMER